eukprot:843726-Prymnesium_polylepis.1
MARVVRRQSCVVAARLKVVVLSSCELNQMRLADWSRTRLVNRRAWSGLHRSGLDLTRRWAWRAQANTAGPKRLKRPKRPKRAGGDPLHGGKDTRREPDTRAAHDTSFSTRRQAGDGGGSQREQERDGKHDGGARERCAQSGSDRDAVCSHPRESGVKFCRVVTCPCEVGNRAKD